MPWELLPLLPLGILAGLLSGLLGIGGGLIFSPLLLALGLAPHQALATSTLAIVPTTLAGSWAHLRSGQVPRPAIAAIGLSAATGALLFSHAGTLLTGWHLLALQSLMYAVLAFVVGPRQDNGPAQGAAGGEQLPLAGELGLEAATTGAGVLQLLAELGRERAELVVAEGGHLLLQQVDVGDDRLVPLQLAGIGITQQQLEHGERPDRAGMQPTESRGSSRCT